MYTLHLYPTADFYNTHSSSKPLVAIVSAIGSILLTLVFFCVYDAMVRKEFLAKKDLLEAKRRFMRFVSHEGT